MPRDDKRGQPPPTGPAVGQQTRVPSGAATRSGDSAFLYRYCDAVYRADSSRALLTVDPSRHDVLLVVDDDESKLRWSRELRCP